MSTQKDFQKDFQSGPSHSHSSLPRLSSTSYVYPVRSLLEGRIQPAPGSDAPPPISSRSSDDIVEFSRINQGQNPQAPAQFASNLNPSDPNPSQSPQSPAPNAITQTNARSRRRAVSIPGSARLPTTLPPSDASTANPPRRRSSRNKSVVLEQFPGADNPYFPRTFSSISLSSPPGESSNSAMLESVQSSMTAEQVLGSQIQGIFSRGPYSLYASPLPSAPTQSHASTSATFLPSNEIANAPPSAPFSMEDTTPMDGLPAQFTPSFSSEPVATPIATYPRHAETRHNQGVHTDEHGLRLPFNPSEYGIVHLPPLPSSSNASERGLSSASSRTRSSTSGRGSNAKKLLRDALASPNPASASSSAAGSGTSREGQRLATLSSTGASGGTPSSGQSHRGSSQTFSSDGIESSITSDEPYVTFKFKSIEDEHGNHVVVGREGKLEQCEDEPIRTPGAVQGFGVLIAVDEANDVLSVRQVSENSSELLGLPAHYLFGLDCFTDILPDSQSCILWDNIEFLTDPDQNAEEEYSPHVFLLSGYGAPGSALPDEPDSVDGKRMWTCWCAAHRSQSLQDGVTTPGLIIMEFEMEKDIMNPLYPPMQRPPTATSPPSKQERHSSGSLPLQQSNRSQSSFGSSSGSGRSTTGNASLASSGDTVAPSTVAFPPNADVVSPPIGLQGDTDWEPAEEDILESTTSYARPLPALERLRKMTRAYGASADAPDASSRRGRRRRGTPGNASATVGMMDIFAVMAQINEQLGAAPDLETYLKVVVGVIKDLTQFHRVMVYQFDEMWNGQVVAELVDWSQTTDLFRGLHFPAGDIPAQARQLYEINKVRLLYDANQPTARIVVRSKKDLDTPLNMTHCYLRAMSPIHIQYLGNMGVRASMSISIMGFGRLWGLVNCHTYGTHGMRVSFPVRQMLRLLSQAISKNIERLSFAKRLHTRKLINPMASDHHPTGYIVSNADDLLGLFDADFGILVIGEGAKILGPNQHGQEILIMAEYLRLKQFKTIQASQAVVRDFPDLELSAGLEIIAGLLYVPLSSGGQDFIAFLRKGQPRKVRWAGRPYKDGQENKLEPRTSFKMWSETVAGRSRMWTDEQLETAAVLALVYGKFIEVWRERENALQAKKLTNLLLSNASHEVRTPLNHIINYLEMAMNGPLDKETRENLKKSHAASKSLLFTINDLLDLTRLESGNETSFNEPFDLHFAVQEATHLYCKEAERRNIQFNLELMDSPSRVVGDAKKIRTVVQNLTANALKYTSTGSITVSCKTYGEPEGLRKLNQTAVEIIVADTGRGISQEKLASIFREFEQVESSEPKSITDPGVGLGLAVVSRIVEQLGGQLRVDSTAGVGSRFSFLIPLSLATEDELFRQRTSSRSSGSSSRAPLEVYDNSRSSSAQSLRPSPEDINNLIQVMSSNYRTRSRESLRGYSSNVTSPNEGTSYLNASRPDHTGFFGVAGAHVPVVIHLQDTDTPQPARQPLHLRLQTRTAPPKTAQDPMHAKLRVLIVEDNDINRTILAKRLTMDGYNVATTTNGQEGLDKVVADRSFDIVLMDLQMPILNGFEATLKIREFELSSAPGERPSHALNGRLPVFAVSASLLERQRDELAAHGMDGWILKPIDFKRLNVILKGVQDPAQRQADVYRPGCNWERGGWLRDGFRNMPRTSY